METKAGNQRPSYMSTKAKIDKIKMFLCSWHNVQLTDILLRSDFDSDEAILLHLPYINLDLFQCAGKLSFMFLFKENIFFLN